MKSLPIRTRQVTPYQQVRPFGPFCLTSTRVVGSLFLLIGLVLPLNPAHAQTSARAAVSTPERESAREIVSQARAAWDSGASTRALELLQEGLRVHPTAVDLHKLYGDLLTTMRRTDEALGEYEAILAAHPEALDVRWSRWSLLLRSGRTEDSITELQRIGERSPHNPLVQLRLALDLRRLDRLEESLVAYKQAVSLRPDMLSWRLGLARAHFDLLDYPSASHEVEELLKQLTPGSPIEIPAKNLLELILSPSKDRGRRYDPILTPQVTEERLKEWAALRADAWRLYSQAQYEEAIPLYEHILRLNPTDSTGAHQLGIALMHVGRCQEAVSVFGRMGEMDASDEAYADTLYRMGQCLVDLGRWEEAHVQFQTLYDAAVEFEQTNKGAAIPPDVRVLDKQKIEKWLEKTRPHVPPELREARPPLPREMSPEELSAKLAAAPLKPQKAIDTRASLMGRDADFSWFRFVIPAEKVVRDDSPTGAHEFIPLEANDTFRPNLSHVYLVFGLVSASYDDVPLAARCFLEALEPHADEQAAAQDQVIMAMNDQSGYFALAQPAKGWVPGLYRCGLYAGEMASADTHVDEVRFRILDRSHPPS